MMPSLSTLAKIKRHFVCVPRDQMVATRDILKHGTRKNVDNAVYVLVHSGFILRIARGVFIRPGGRWPTVEEIAEFKANKFNRTMRIHGSDSADRLNLGSEPNENATFYVDAGSSSFAHWHGRIYFKGVSKKRIRLEDDPVGLAIRALWSRGEKQLKISDIQKRGMPWNGSRTNFMQVIMSKQWMPAWLADCFLTSDYVGPPPIRYAIPN